MIVSGPARRATIAIGDVHGNLSALDGLLRTVAAEIAPTDTVVFVGDYIDRGLQSKACVDRILAFELETRRDCRRQVFQSARCRQPANAGRSPGAAAARAR